MVQFGYGKVELLAYQNNSYKKTARFLSEQPTYGVLLVNLAMAKMDPNILSIGEKVLAGKGLSKTDTIPEVKMSGNQISITGLKKKIVVSNNYELELSYGDKKIPFNKSVDIEKNIKDIEDFFSKYEVGSLYQQLFVGEYAHALGPIAIGLILGTVFVTGFIGWDMGRRSETAFSEWFFGADGLDDDIEFRCEAGQFTVANGPESLSFKFDNMMVEKRTASRKGYLHDMHIATYYNREKSEDGFQTISFFSDNSEVYAREKFFDPVNYSPQKTRDLAELAKNVLGKNGERKICKGSKFVDSATERKFEELQIAVNKARKSKDKNLLNKVKQLDSENQSR